MAKVSYDRCYRNIPLSASAGRFSTEDIEAARVGPFMVSYTGRNRLVTGVDLSTGEGEDLTAFTTLESLGDRWRVINIESGYWTGPEIIKRMIDHYRRFHKGLHKQGITPRFRVESNAQQKYILQMTKSAEIMRAMGAETTVLKNIVVDSHTTTGFNKRDFDYGIPSLADDLQMGRLILPKDGQEIDNLVAEMQAWSMDLGHHSGDRLISLWIAKTGLNIKPCGAAVV